MYLSYFIFISTLESAWVEDGCPRGGEQPLGMYRLKTDKACVRCCSSDGFPCSTPFNCGPKNQWITYNEAVSKCNEDGKRLCTKAELLNNVCCSSGGGGDSYLVWAVIGNMS